MHADRAKALEGKVTVAWKNVCKVCESQGIVKRFKNLDNLKDHMTKHHGGWTGPELAGSGQTSEETSAPRGEAPNSAEGEFRLTPDAPAEREESPRRSTKHNRELNAKVNSAIDTVIEKALGMPVSQERLDQLKEVRTEIRNVAFGIEFDFDESKITKKINSRWALIFLIAVLYLIPYMPPIPFQKLLAELKTGKKKPNESNANRRSDRPEGERQDVSSVADVRPE